jgi:hypothetical protein
VRLNSTLVLGNYETGHWEDGLTAKIIVTVLGLALIVFVNRYFLFSRRKLGRHQ